MKQQFSRHVNQQIRIQTTRYHYRRHRHQLSVKIVSSCFLILLFYSYLHLVATLDWVSREASR